MQTISIKTKKYNKVHLFFSIQVLIAVREFIDIINIKIIKDIDTQIEY